MIDALRVLGVPVPYLRDGPFSVREADLMVNGFGYELMRANHLCAGGVPAGRYLILYGASMGVVGHAVAGFVDHFGFTVIDGRDITRFAGHVAWHYLAPGVSPQDFCRIPETSTSNLSDKTKAVFGPAVMLDFWRGRGPRNKGCTYCSLRLVLFRHQDALWWRLVEL